MIPAAALLWLLGTADLPRFDRDTVLVWQAENRGHTSEFVVRLARFEPDRYFEWEGRAFQGTVWIDRKALEESRSFLVSRLFQAGVDSREKESTALWLSATVFRELKQKGSADIKMDSIPGKLRLLRQDLLEVTVNKKAVTVPVLVVQDSRGGEWRFLDDESNPLFLQQKFREFTQTLRTISTDRKDTLRWIKGRKLEGP
ncbi:MAG: hypothetical protein HY652_13900 [Acidobacteria bacterium]|nr:hypothetical protein [Acidobacteriota bacterium]